MAQHRQDRSEAGTLAASFAGTTVTTIEPREAARVGIWEEKEEPSEKMEDRPGK